MVAEECEGEALSSHSCGSACPMRVFQRAVREIIIDHMCYMAEIESSACDAGGDNRFDLLFLKSIEN